MPKFAEPKKTGRAGKRRIPKRWWGSTGAVVLLSCLSGCARNTADPNIIIDNSVQQGAKAEYGDIAGALEKLRNPDSVYEALDELKYAAGEGADITIAVPELAKLLLADDEYGDVQLRASEVLATAAEKGIDVASAIPQLAAKLSEISEWENSGRKPGKHGLIVNEGTRNSLIVHNATTVFGSSAKRGKDISAAVPVLIELISNVEHYTSAFLALYAAADNGTDLSAAIPKLVGLLGYADEGRRTDAEMCLGIMLSVEKDGKVMRTLMGIISRAGRADEDELEIANAAMAFTVAGRRSVDISPAIPGLAKLLPHPNDTVQFAAHWALGNAFANQGEVVEELSFMLSSPDARARFASLRTLELAASNGADISPAAPQIEELVSDPDGEVREVAERLSKKMGAE